MVTPQELQSNKLSSEPPEFDDKMTNKIDPANNKYPFCIVWSPLPVITWFFPFIGHTGIGNSDGVLVNLYLNFIIIFCILLSTIIIK